ncbi:2-amino-4-hydroxy-6-hydroxymethyldihydropteridine diphosphokinase [Sphaerochaeta sp. PS]|uniref:2-amino-4-hydroxy-6- hydroxymethyldihydropteridine diphosphokinase n=1 Tax=Sphaerochaeta sp. PS TaxID=3076336 RepID=UPI0028A3CB61|nr:2-amino-4-hydroxy-6-hydroxymethyldihydropteridine diphosphokinase [Sphaerochaeta sp. PS]MDT4761783.1 2-amino-4-hydroxy-6-hydroxymethyldihydropteridine diphosphokinase [Sphaerochaeta sp. PS]
MKRSEHGICLLLGSNIEPEDNLPRAIVLLQKHLCLIQTSSVWESRAVGSDGPNFLNAAVLATTSLDADTLRLHLLRPLEAQLGRVRTSDKNAPRTLDIDLIIYDQKLLDPSLWKYAHLALPVSELLPTYRSETGAYLKDFALLAAASSGIWVRADVSDYPFSTVFSQPQY